MFFEATQTMPHAPAHFAGLGGLGTLGDTGIQGRHDISQDEVIRGTKFRATITNLRDHANRYSSLGFLLNILATEFARRAYRVDAKVRGNYGEVIFELTLLHDKDNAEGVFGDFREVLENAELNWDNVHFEWLDLPPDEGGGGGTQTGGGGTQTGGSIPSGTPVSWGINAKNYWTDTLRSTANAGNSLVRELKNEFTYVTLLSSTSNATAMGFDLSMRTGKVFQNADEIKSSLERAADRANLSITGTRFLEVGNITSPEKRKQDDGSGKDPDKDKTFLDQIQDFFDKSFFGGAITGGVLVVGLVIGALVLKNK